MKGNILYLLVIFMLITTGTVFAQNTQELRVGSALSGNLGRGQEIFYSLTAAQTGILTVETTGSVDTYLEVYDTDWNYIDENDDGPNGLNARLTIIAFQGVTYIFILSGYDENVSGRFGISASLTPFIQLRTGTAYNGRIEEEEYIVFSFIADRSGLLTIETAGQTDTYIMLYDNDFIDLAYDDDGAGYPNDRITHRVTSGTVYYIEVGAYESGPFTVTARIQ